MVGKQKYSKTIATIIVVSLVALVIYMVSPFFSSLFAAFMLFVIFSPVHKWLVKKKLSSGFSATIILIIVALVVIIPLALMINSLVNEISSLANNQDDIMAKFNAFDQKYPQINVTSIVGAELSNGEEFVKNTMLAILNNTSKIVVSLFIMFFTLYFLLVHSEEIAGRIRMFSPFSRKNTDMMYMEFKNITNATIITTGLVSLFQGAVLALGFIVFGIKGALFWGFVGFIFAFLPFIGISFIWIPAGIIQIVFEHNYFAGIGIMIWGLILSNIDNLIRPLLQQKIGKMHPFVTILGVFVGIPLFGIMGIFVGPLLISFAFIVTKIYFEEYVTDK